MAKTYRIDLIVNNTQADASARRSVAALGTVDRAAEKTAATVERLAAREAAAYDRNALRAQRAADRKADAEVKAAEKAARQKQSIEDRMVAREASRMVASERAAQRAADATVRAKEKEARQVQAIEDRYLRREHDRMRAAAAQQQRGGGPGGVTGFLADAGKLAGPAATLGAAVFAISESFAAVNERIRESTNLVTGYQESLLELAALKGSPGKTAEVMADDLGFRLKTLQTAPASAAFQLAALGVGEASIDTDKAKRLISKEDFTRSLEFGGAFQAAEGGDAATHGRLIGMIPQMIGRRTTAEEVIRKEAQYYNIMKPGGFSFSSGADQFGKLAPLITTGLFKDTEALALLSAFSTTNPQGAGTNVEQFTRGTVGSLGRMRGVSIEGAEKIGPYLKSLGATNQMSPIDIGNLISADITKFEGSEKAAGREANVMDYLKHHGYANVEDISAISAFHGLRKSGALQDTFLPLAQDAAMPSMDEAGAFAERFRRGRVGQKRAVELAGTAADANLGNETMAGYDAQHEAAFHRLRKDRNFFTAGMDYKDTQGGGLWGSLADAAIRTEMYADLNKRRQAVGLDEVVETGGSWKTGTLSTVADRAAQFAAAEREIAAAGGEAGVNIAPLVELARRSLELDERQVAALEKMAGGGDSWGTAGSGASWAPDSAAPVAGAIR